MTVSHPRYIPYHQQPQAGCEHCGEPFECNHYPIQEETMERLYPIAPDPEVCVHGLPVAGRCMLCDQETRKYRAYQATAKQPATEEDILTMIACIDQQIAHAEQWCEQASWTDGNSKQAHAALYRWQRALMTAYELYECWETDQDLDTETAHDTRKDHPR